MTWFFKIWMSSEIKPCEINEWRLNKSYESVFALSRSLGLVFLYHFVRYLAVQMPEESVYCCFYCLNFLCLLVGNVKSEIFLHSDNKFDWVQRVKTKLLECRSPVELFLIALGGTPQDLEHFGFNFLHQGDLAGIRCRCEEIIKLEMKGGGLL